MKKTDFKKIGIIKSLIDNGYRCSKTYQYVKINNNNIVLYIDKINHYGIKCFVISVNDELLKINDKTLYFETLEDAEKNIINIFNRCKIENYFTLVF